jgi:hypothetical protein
MIAQRPDGVALARRSQDDASNIARLAMKVDGSCHCGNIRYEAEIDPERVSICHCTDCQELTATAYRVTVPVARENFKLLKGTPKIYLKSTADSGRKRVQAFCGECGTPLYATDPDQGKNLGLRVGSMKQRAELAPKRQIWFRSALPWALDLHGVAHIDRE